MTYSEWDNIPNAKLYERYTQTYPISQATAQKLIKLANIQADMSIIDLACGTGAITAQILAKPAHTGTIIAVDQSAAMLDIAKQKFPASRVCFLHSAAETVHEVLPPASVDLALCNSAFWQMRMKATLDALHTILKSKARFIFNLPPGVSIPNLRSPASFAQRMLQIARDEYDYIPPQRRGLSLTLNEMQRILQASSFMLISSETATFEKTIDDLHAFYHIPIMIQSFLPGLNYTTRRQIVDKTYREYGGSHKEVFEWRFYIAELTSSDDLLPLEIPTVGADN